jgi:hypothetical protein
MNILHQPVKERSMLQVQGPSEIPADTRKVAEAAFPQGNLVMALGNQLGVYTLTSSSKTCFQSEANRRNLLLD